MRVPSYVVLEKQVGQTPLEAIQEWQHTHPKFASLPATYAGRLDPMASGKLLVLLGDECKKREKYTGLDKEYEIQVVLDLSTDTGDALGLAEYVGVNTKPDTKMVKEALALLTGPHLVPYPAFSSKTVNGTPLFMYALRGELNTISIPEHLETVYKANGTSSYQLSKEDLRARIELHLSNVPVSDEPSKELGQDFRQHEIRARWQTLFDTLPERTFTVLTLRVACASGTYMRTLAKRLARELKTTGFALSIHRTKIGTYRTLGPLSLWIRKY